MRSALAALAGACALTLSACGNSSQNDGTTATTVADHSTTVTSVTPPSASSGTSRTSSPSDSAASQSSASSGSSTSSGSASGHAGSGAAQGSGAPGTSAPPSSTGSTRASGTASVPGQASGSASATGGSGTTGTGGGHSYTAASWSQFTSPTGRNWCDMNEGAVGCQLTTTLSAQHGGANYVMLSARGVGFITGDPGMDEDGSASRWAASLPGVPTTKKDGYAVLSYGSTITSNRTTCTSTRNGFTCTNGIAGFTVNAESVTLTGRRASS